MLFSSVSFLCYFLPLCLLAYYLMPVRSARNVVLTAFSLFFYGFGGVKNLLVMMVSILINWALALIIDAHRHRPRVGKSMVFLAVLCNIGLIFYYKYTKFFAMNFASIFGVGREWASAIQVALPIGISFFTFQALSYVIDVYRGQGEVQKNPLWVALYISAFPQLIAGPIVRYETVAAEIKHRKENVEDFAQGFRRFIYGFAKKILLANTMGEIADQIFAFPPGEVAVATLWVGAIAYSLQIYHDFSGYSDMAIGLGRMLGFHYLENFDYPYIADSITDFWRRWHISLSTWFRDYVYIPLGGNRKGKARQVVNLLIVWLVTGLWHGAAWNFVLWGAYYGILLIGEKFVWGRLWEKLPRALRHIAVLLIVICGWVIFRAEGLRYALTYLQGMFGAGMSALANAQSAVYIVDRWPFWIAALLASVPLKSAGKALLARLPGHQPAILLRSAWEIGVFALAFLFMVSSSYNPFIYFNF